MKPNKIKPTLNLKQKTINQKLKSSGMSPLVKELSGVAKLKLGSDEKNLYVHYLSNKYSK
jgi:hypothetical protein